MENHLVPGEQAVNTISAMEGGFAEKVLRMIAHPNSKIHNPENNKRVFDDWSNGICFGKVIISNNGNKPEEREVVLKLNVKEGLFLKDHENFGKFSLKHKCDGKRCIIPVSALYNGRRGGDKKRASASSVANNIIASWIIHGYGWIDRKGKQYYWPYGIDINRKISYAFSVIDGKNMGTFSDAIEKGAIRSGHIGTWESPVMLVPAATGLPVILHEFQEKSDNIVMFGDKRISPKAYDEVWGPYVEWDSNVFNQVDFGGFQESAQASVCPFNFHVAAIQKLFPNCILSSKFLFDRIKKDKVLEILRIIVEKDPERYYRLIDDSGLTYKLTKIDDGYAIYSGSSGNIRFNLKEAPENALDTFIELAKIQNDPGYKINRKVRVVLDAHFFVVLFGILTAKNGESHHISGRYMYKYLLEGQDSGMHRIRNDRLFCLIKKIFKIDELKFMIYPSVSLRLPRVNQYNFNPKTWNPKHWLGKNI